MQRTRRVRRVACCSLVVLVPDAAGCRDSTRRRGRAVDATPTPTVSAEVRTPSQPARPKPTTTSRTPRAAADAVAVDHGAGHQDPEELRRARRPAVTSAGRSAPRAWASRRSARSACRCRSTPRSSSSSGSPTVPASRPNPCLADQVQWVEDRGLMAAAYAVNSYPDARDAAASTATTARSTARTRLGRPQQRRLPAGPLQRRPPCAAPGSARRSCGSTSSRSPSSSGAATEQANAAVVVGAARGYTDSGYPIGDLLDARAVGRRRRRPPRGRPRVARRRPDLAGRGPRAGARATGSSRAVPACSASGSRTAATSTSPARAPRRRCTAGSTSTERRARRGRHTTPRDRRSSTSAGGSATVSVAPGCLITRVGSMPATGWCELHAHRVVAVGGEADATVGERQVRRTGRLQEAEAAGARDPADVGQRGAEPPQAVAHPQVGGVDLHRGGRGSDAERERGEAVGRGEGEREACSSGSHPSSLGCGSWLSDCTRTAAP